jgi:EamA domain-containing membrane protein RarD
MPSVGFESVIPANKRLQTYALDCTVTGIGYFAFTYDYSNQLHFHTPHALLYFIDPLMSVFLRPFFFSSSGMLYRIDWYIVTVVLKDYKAFIFGVKQSKKREEC